VRVDRRTWPLKLPLNEEGGPRAQLRQQPGCGFIEQLGLPRVDTAARHLGLALVGVGTLAMVIAVWNYWSLNQYLAASPVALNVPKRVKARWYYSYVVAAVVLEIGVITFLFMLKVI
jgi:hypothetical protein